MSDAPKKPKKNINKAKTKTPMREQSPDERIRNFDEVPLGYTPEMAIEEAKRCIQCKRPFCTEGCPVAVDIPAFIQLSTTSRFT